MKKRMPAASEIVAKFLNELGDNISVDEVEAIYERNAADLPDDSDSKPERRKIKRKKQTAEQVEKEAMEWMHATSGRIAWLLLGKYPAPPEWEKPIIQNVMKLAMNGDDKALAWLKQRFPPGEGLS